MTATVSGGSIGRWFEELCRVKHHKFSEVVVTNKHRIKPGVLPSCGGVYALWWTGDTKLLTSRKCNRFLVLVGPGGRDVELEMDDEWLGITSNLPIPLYVGKSAANIAKRVGQHVRLSEKRTLPLHIGIRKAKPPTTSCQLRAGIDRLFPFEGDTRQTILDNVGLSYISLDGDQHAVNRFYLEDLAIGLMRPVLNVDIER